MNYQKPPAQSLQYFPEAWRSDEQALSREACRPDPRDRSLLLGLLGRINHRILKGRRVYVEAGGVVYKTVYGGYWRSVFTGVEHYSLRCKEVSGAIWIEGNRPATEIDLAIEYSNGSWTANGHSLAFILSREPAQARGDI